MMFKAIKNSTSGEGGCATFQPSLLKPLLFVLAATLLALAFAMLGSEVGEGDTLFVDMQVLQRAQALRAGHPWLAEVMRDLSGLGSTVVLTLFTLATVGYRPLYNTAWLEAGQALAQRGPPGMRSKLIATGCRRNLLPSIW